MQQVWSSVSFTPTTFYSSYAKVVLDITKVVDVYVVTVVGYFVKKKNEKQYNILHTWGGLEDTWALKTRSLILFVAQSTGLVVNLGELAGFRKKTKMTPSWKILLPNNDPMTLFIYHIRSIPPCFIKMHHPIILPTHYAYHQQTMYMIWFAFHAIFFFKARDKHLSCNLLIRDLSQLS